MPDLNFQIEGAETIRYAAAPQLALKVRITQVGGGGPPARIQSVILNCQVRLEPGRRRYSEREQERLFELFGEPQRWGQTVRSALWANTSVIVPPFEGSVLVDVPIACTGDMRIASTKYFLALEDGQIPLCMLFSGTIFYSGEDGALQVGQISWEREADFRLPVSLWNETMDIYFPKSAWLMLQRDLFDRLVLYKRDQALHTWEQTIESLLAGAAAGVPDE